MVSQPILEKSLENVYIGDIINDTINDILNNKYDMNNIKAKLLSPIVDGILSKYLIYYYLVVILLVILIVLLLVNSYLIYRK